MNALPPVAIASVLLAGCALSTFTAARWHQRLVVAEQQVKEAQVREARTLSVLKARQQAIADIDARYTQELTHAHEELDRLERDVAAGLRRLRVKGNCSVSTTRPGSLGHAGTIELSSIAGRNVLDIRAGIISDQEKIKYLQDYIRIIIDETDKK